MEDLASLRAGAATADGVIHTAFNNISETTTDIAGAIEVNVRAIEALGEALADSGRPHRRARGCMASPTRPSRSATLPPSPARTSTSR